MKVVKKRPVLRDPMKKKSCSNCLISISLKVILKLLRKIKEERIRYLITRDLDLRIDSRK